MQGTVQEGKKKKITVLREWDITYNLKIRKVVFMVVNISNHIRHTLLTQDNKHSTLEWRKY